MPALVAISLAYGDQLAVFTVTPRAAIDADREDTAEGTARVTVWASKLKRDKLALVVAAIRKSPTKFLVGTARWFELFAHVVGAAAATEDSVTSFAEAAMLPPNAWLPVPVADATTRAPRSARRPATMTTTTRSPPPRARHVGRRLKPKSARSRRVGARTKRK